MRREKDAAWKKFENDSSHINLSLALHLQGEYEKKEKKNDLA